MKALELAEMFGNCDRWTELKDSHFDQAAAELRRLAEVNAELVDEMEKAAIACAQGGTVVAKDILLNAIAKAKEQQ